MSTALPLKDEDDAFVRPFIEQGFDVDSVCYFGESILLPEYRGQGLECAFSRRARRMLERLPACVTPPFVR